MQKRVKIVSTLLDSLPFIKEFSGQKVVIKYGGSAQLNPELKEQFALDIVLMYLVGIRPIIVHGGGKRITELLADLGIQSRFAEDGLRITCSESMKIVEMVLSGEINKEIVGFLNHHGVKAVGLSGKDGGFIKASAKDSGKYGFTGKVHTVEPQLINNLLDDGFVPVIAPVGFGAEAGHPGYNINADSAASEVAVALGAKKVLFLTDTPGVLDESKTLQETLTRSQTESMIRSGVIQGGMIPKVEACLQAIEGGVEKAHIIDGRIEHSLLLELFTSEGIGTQIVRE